MKKYNNTVLLYTSLLSKQVIINFILKLIILFRMIEMINYR